MALDLSFKDLADAAERHAGMDGRPLLLPLCQIDEDRDQPRRSFSEDELAQLAESIRLVGILQPIVVRPGEISGRYLITMGARRYRAARLAGLDAVPAIVQERGALDRYAQIIENIQRDDLAAAEIAEFITTQLVAGEKQADIARKLGKPKDWVSRFAAIPKMPSFLKAKLESSSIRSVYELYQAWRTQPEAIEQICSEQDSFTDAQARRVAHELRSRLFTPAVEALDKIPNPALANERSDLLRTVQKAHAPERACSQRQQRKRKPTLSILVRHRDREGHLLIDAPANKGSRFASVRFFGTGQTEEVPVSELRIVEMAPC